MKYDHCIENQHALEWPLIQLAYSDKKQPISKANLFVGSFTVFGIKLWYICNILTSGRFDIFPRSLVSCSLVYCVPVCTLLQCILHTAM